MQDDELQMELQEAYANCYNEIVQPDRVFVASQYFRRKWVPLLGPALAWLIIALRQRCYWNRKTGEVRAWCLVSHDELAVEVGLDRKHVGKLLSAKYADWFIVDMKKRYEYNPRIGKTVRAKTRYLLRMDDPLTPEDRDELGRRIAEGKAGIAVDPETGQVDMLKALDGLMSGHLDAYKDLGEVTYAPTRTTVYAPTGTTTNSTSITPEKEKKEEKDPGNEIWREALRALELQIGRGQVATLLSNTRAERLNGHWVVKCSNDYWREWMDARLRRTITAELETRVGQVEEIKFVRGRVK